MLASAIRYGKVLRSGVVLEGGLEALLGYQPISNLAPGGSDGWTSDLISYGSVLA